MIFNTLHLNIINLILKKMKNILFLLLIVLTVSCGKSKQEQMLYDYQSKGVKDLFNTNLEELDFKINSVEKIGEIKASDSIKIYKDKLVTLWFGRASVQNEKDTLKYEYVITELDTLINAYQGLILSHIKSNQAYLNYDLKEKRNNSIKEKVYVESWKSQSDFYNKKPDSILSTKYKANYSITNPVLKLKQSFDKIYYTDAGQTKFIHEEIDKESK